MRRSLAILFMGLFLLSQGLVLLHHHGELGHRHAGYCCQPDERCPVGDFLSPAPLARAIELLVGSCLLSRAPEPAVAALPIPTPVPVSVPARGPPVLL